MHTHTHTLHAWAVVCICAACLRCRSAARHAGCGDVLVPHQRGVGPVHAAWGGRAEVGEAAALYLP
eukprot:1161718-Pelagomonas_calceolata.AAC.4